jgi:Kdo2-lipid IVA lauroyltransferase/acyltransferase
MHESGYFLMKTVTWIFHILPMRVNYIISDFLYFLVYHIARYRRDVVRENLQNSFPQKTSSDLKAIEQNFYHHLCDTFIETLYFDRISAEEAKKRVKFINPELANNYLDQGKSVVVFLGHYNNWEWLTTWTLYSKYRFYAIYKKLKSETFEKFYFNLRNRFGTFPLERAETFRQIIGDNNQNIANLSSFIFDQTPRIHEIQYWTKFLNQDSAVIVGGEKVARKINATVLFAHMRKIKRGYYEVEYILITENAGETDKFEVTEKCTRYLEKVIMEKPQFWLWSHKRWKHKKPVV